MKWKKFQLKNVQSWEDCTVDLSDGLTVIKANSETGKSVFIKCLRILFYFSEYPTDERISIIRNWDKGTKYGQLSITLEDDSEYIIAFSDKLPVIIHREFNQPAERLVYSKETLEKVGKDISIIPCEKFEKILNVLDNETELLFDRTRSSFVGSVMDVYLTDKKLEEEIKTTKENIDALDFSIQKRRGEYGMVSQELDQYGRPIDIERVEQTYKDLMQETLELEKMTKLKNTIDNIKSISIRREMELQELETLIEKLIKMLELYTTINKVVAIRKLPVIKLSEVEEQIKKASRIGEMNDLITQIKDCEILPVTNEISTLNALIEKKEYIYNLICLTESYIEERKNVAIGVSNEDLINIEDGVEKLSKYKKLGATVKEQLGNIQELNLLLEKQLELNKEFSQFKEEYPSCPTCNQSIKGVVL